MFKSLIVIQLFFTFNVVLAHGDAHEEPSSAKWKQYAQKHMATEHHIDTFDARSFFHLHDLNRDGFLDRDEIEAIYGVHHPYSQKKSRDEQAHQMKADHIVNVVLGNMDKNKDGKLSPEEFEAAGLNALPMFEGLGAEGHHYDVESEFFLHHEEEYHSTPETQTDESYNHPEDLEHFAQHEEIERQEAMKEAKFQGISVEEAIAQHDHVEAPPSPSSEEEQHDAHPAADYEIPAHPHDDQLDSDKQIPIQEPPAKPKVQRPPKVEQEPSVKYADARRQSGSSDEWGTGDSGYKIPKTPSDRMRKNVPYKYKFRRNWGDF